MTNNDSDTLIDYNLASMTQRHILQTIDVCEGNLTQAALLLGIGYRTLTTARRRWVVRERMFLDPVRHGKPKYKDSPNMKFAKIITAQADRIRELELEVERIKKVISY